MNVGLIGCGEMGTALFTRLSKRGDGSHTYVSDPTRDFSQVSWIDEEVTTSRDCADVIANCAVVFIAIPPPLLPPMLKEHAALIAKHRPLMVSMCGTGSLADMRAAIGPNLNVKLFRMMPNTPSEVGKGVTALCVEASNPATAEEVACVRRLLEKVGAVSQVEEREIHYFTNAYGCAPAYNYITLEALSDGAVEVGFARDLANQLAIHNVLNACETLLADPSSCAIADPVNTPGVREKYSDGLKAI